jgi:hypothetical protein
MFIKHPPIGRMQLKIDKNKTLGDLQQEFNHAFPFLKLEFFRNGNTLYKKYPTLLLLDKSLTVQEARRMDKNGELDIGEEMTVGELENEFRNRFGLTVQIFRKSGKLWLETTMTEHWTLKQQNEHGEEISNPPPPENHSTD